MAETLLMKTRIDLFEEFGEWFYIEVECRWFRLEILSHFGGDCFWLPRFKRWKSVIREGYNWQTEHRLSWLTGAVRVRRVINKQHP
jgi:hypothetical protein